MKIQSFLVALVTLLTVSSFAQEPQFREFEHFRELPSKYESGDINSDRVIVTEMFSYSCVHCFNFEGDLEEWLAQQGNEVDFRREHVVFSSAGLSLAKAFYAAEELGVTDKIHHSLFSAIHVNGLRMNQLDLLVRLFEGRGETSAEDFQAVFNGFGVENRIRRSDTLVRTWRIEGTPTMVVDGSYIAGGTTARRPQQILAVVDFLVDKVLADRAAQRNTGS